MLNKPYKRIYRENQISSEDYLSDERYADGKMSFIHAYHLLEKDLKELFDYVSPHDSNKKTFSHRIYELFFRACTEFESNAKAILVANRYNLPKCATIKNDYFKINNALKLDKYSIKLNIWDNSPLTLSPFQAWNIFENDKTIYAELFWYKDYNLVKHNRTQNFHLANLLNLINAIAGVLLILYAQFGDHAFSPFQPIAMIDRDTKYISASDSLFQIKLHDWTETEKYSFDWNVLRNSLEPFNFFNF